MEAANAITAATNELEGSTSEKVEAKAVERKKEGQKLQEDLFEKVLYFLSPSLFAWASCLVLLRRG